MKIDLDGQVAIVTGAGRGIGKEIATMAADAGAKVVLVSRTATQLEHVAGEIRASGGTALPYCADITDRDAVKAMAKAALSEYGRIDVLVNNAATNYVALHIMAKEDEIRRVFELNTFAVFNCAQAVLKPMIRQKSGRIINISSVAAKIGAAYNSAYSASKAAVLAFTRSLAKETARAGITVNAVCPWHVDTELVHEGMGERGKMFGMSSAQYLAKIADENPQKRLMTPREIAAVVMLLMSHEGRGINGQSINVDGGFVMD